MGIIRSLVRPTFVAVAVLLVIVSVGPRVATAHTGLDRSVPADGVWAGGVLALAVLITARRRRRDPTLAVEMLLPFSFVAAIALASVTAAGLLMAWFIDSDVVAGPSNPWRRVLWVKVGLVVATAAIGGYNHFRLRPQLVASPDDAELVVHLQRTVIVETALLAAAGAASAILVTASTV